MIKEFKEFIMKGNVLDLAVAVIIAGAFGVIINSFVNDILMPPIGMALGGVDFSQLQYVIQEAVVENGETTSEAVAIRWGQFVQHVISFIITAFAIFMVIKAYNKTQAPPEEAAPAGPSTEDLLTEIRDVLKSAAK